MVRSLKIVLCPLRVLRVMEYGVCMEICQHHIYTQGVHYVFIGVLVFAAARSWIYPWDDTCVDVCRALAAHAIHVVDVVLNQ